MMDSIDAELNQLQTRLSELNQEQKFIQERIVQLQAERQRMANIAPENAQIGLYKQKNCLYYGQMQRKRQ